MNILPSYKQLTTATGIERETHAEMVRGREGEKTVTERETESREKERKRDR